MSSAQDIVPVTQNRRARHDYEIQSTVEAGLELRGTEVKSLRAGNAALSDAYVRITRGEAFLMGAHIGEYEQGNQFNHEPRRTRRLLLRPREIEEIHIATTQKGLVAIPISLYFKKGWAKVEVAIGKPRKKADKRHTIKEKETRREVDRAMRRAHKR